jgi:probable HAF family extracellular repeat protein
MRTVRTAFFGGIGALAGAAAAQPHYMLTEVTPQPLRVWAAYDLGAQGQVVGRTYDLNVSPPLSRGFVWQNNTMSLLDGPNGETLTEVRAIDRNGTVYGGYADRRFPLSQLKMNPARWVNGSCVPYANNDGINSATIFGCSPTTGVAVGWAKPFTPGALGWRGEYGYASEPDFGSSDPVRAFSWSNGSGSVLAKLLGAHDDAAMAINDAGQAAFQLTSFELGGAAVYDPRFGLARLPGLGVGEPGTMAYSINAAGQIVGSALASGTIEHPVRWTDGQLTDLGLLPGLVEGKALRINDAGVIVGGLSDHNFAFGVQSTLGFIVVSGIMYNLNDLIPQPGTFVVQEADAINNAGQILAVMNPPPSLGNPRYAVLTPIP